MAPHAEVAPVTDTSSVVVPDPVLVKGETNSRFTIDDVLPHRQQSEPISTIVAGFSSAHLFKSKKSANKPKAKRWDHCFSTESKSRQPSSLKGAMKYFKRDTISLCGGLPSP
jgi:aromatic amino acid aminotransferase I